MFWHKTTKWTWATQVWGRLPRSSGAPCRQWVNYHVITEVGFSLPLTPLGSPWKAHPIKTSLWSLRTGSLARMLQVLEGTHARTAMKWAHYPFVIESKLSWGASGQFCSLHVNSNRGFCLLFFPFNILAVSILVSSSWSFHTGSYVVFYYYFMCSCYSY